MSPSNLSQLGYLRLREVGAMDCCVPSLPVNCVLLPSTMKSKLEYGEYNAPTTIYATPSNASLNQRLWVEDYPKRLSIPISLSHSECVGTLLASD
jgi:hypothetical protein